jgi:hypothetical protein
MTGERGGAALSTILLEVANRDAALAMLTRAAEDVNNFRFGKEIARVGIRAALREYARRRAFLRRVLTIAQEAQR